MADEAEDLRKLQAQFAALPVDDLLASSASTIASLAYAKLEAGDLTEARRAIDALQSLLPHTGTEHAGDLRGALTDLQVAFAAAASR